MGLKFANKNSFLNGIVDFYIPNSKCGLNICVGATELCKKYCYGNGVYRHSNKRGAKMLNTEEIARENYRITQSDTFVKEMNELIEQTREQMKGQLGGGTEGILRIRIHSIGDFYSYEYFLKWIKIIKANREIQFTAYVKNFDVLEKYKNYNGEVFDNLNILLSFYPDTYDRYKLQGGKQYIDNLFKELVSYYGAKKYIVCSREFFRKEIAKRDPQKFFCNGGTEMLSQWDEKLDINSFSDLFVPGESCDECLKCYSEDKCPKGANIYALLRASSKLANIDSVLETAQTNEFTELRKMYPNEI